MMKRIMVGIFCLFVLSLTAVTGMIGCKNVPDEDRSKNHESKSLSQPSYIPDPMNRHHQNLAASYSSAKAGISLVVMHDGEIIFEDYGNGGFPEWSHELASGTKSFSSVLAAAAAQDGLLTFDENVSETIKEWKGDARKSKITIRQLLNLTSGLETGGERGNVPTYEEALKAPAMHDPGTRFTYGALPFQVLASSWAENFPIRI